MSQKKGTCDNVNFRSNPNFIFKEDIRANCDSLGGSCNFETYYNPEDQKAYILTPDIETFDINMISLETNQIVKSLKGHKERVLNVRYFLRESDGTEFLISADRKQIVIVWNLSTFTLVKAIETKYEYFVYSCLLYFDKEDFAITSSIGGNGGTKMYKLPGGEEAGSVNSDFNVYCLNLWKNKTDGKSHVIQVGKNQIIINSIIDNQLSNTRYAEWNTGNDAPYNLGASVYTKEMTDYLIVTATYGSINIWDLAQKSHFKTIKIEDAHLYNVQKWNDDYLILLDNSRNWVTVIDLNTYELIASLYFNKFNYERYIKKVDHPKYGECLATINPLDNVIRLFTTREITV